MSLFSSTAYSIGSSLTNGSMNPVTINVDASSLASELTVIPDCSASVNTSISDAIAIVNTSETSFYSKDGLHKQMIDATNALRGERNDLCMRIWGNRTAIGDLNNKITRLESLRGFINMETIEDIVE